LAVDITGPAFAGMRGANRILFALMLALLPAFGCGTLTWRTTATDTPSVQDIAEEFQNLSPSSPGP
jgi:hypothetical protein